MSSLGKDGRSSDQSVGLASILKERASLGVTLENKGSGCALSCVVHVTVDFSSGSLKGGASPFVKTVLLDVLMKELILMLHSLDQLRPERSVKVTEPAV